MSHQARAKTTTWMGKVPSHWDVKALKYCADLVMDRVNGSEVNFQYVGLEHIESKTGRLIREDGSQENAESTVNCFFRDDVLFGKLRPYLAKAAVAESNGVCSSEILVYRPHGLTPQYLKHVMLLDGFIEEVNASTYGSKMPRADAAFISRLPVPRPPIDEQIAIAAYLDAETKRIDALVGEKRKLFKVLTELKKSIVTEAITLGIDKTVSLVDSGLEWAKKIPAGWRVASLKRFVRLIGGHTPSTTNPSYWDGDVPWYSPKDMKSDELKDSIDHVTCSAVEESGLSVIDSKTTMIVVRGMILAHTFPVCVTQVPGTLNQDMKALIPDETIEPTYLPWLLRGVAPLFLSLTDQSGHGTLALRTDRFMSEALPIPPKTVQLEIISFIETERKKLDDLLAHVHKEIDLLIEMRSATITDAVLGRIDVRKSQTH